MKLTTMSFSIQWTSLINNCGTYSSLLYVNYRFDCIIVRLFIGIKVKEKIRKV